MPATAFGHALETLHDGLTIVHQGEGMLPLPCPLTATDIHVTPIGALALVRIERRFRNGEDAPIEVVLTMPVAFDAVVTGLSVMVDARNLTATVQAKDTARATYEDAIDRGKLAILHEEVLRGVHMLSVANLAPKAEVMVTHEFAMPMTRLTGGALLRLPMTVGVLYGASPLCPADDLVSSTAIRHTAHLVLATGHAELLGRGTTLRAGIPMDLPLDSAIELRFDSVEGGRVVGADAYGRRLSVDVQSAPESDGQLDLAILVDRSGSTGAPAGDALTVHEAMTQGLADGLRTLRGNDHIGLWQFDDECQFLGAATGPAVAHIVQKLEEPQGGTELGNALRMLVDHGARDVLVMTDGQTWAHEVDKLASIHARISAVLVGSASLDANVGHLATMTGGQVFHAAGANVGTVLVPAVDALRLNTGPVAGRVVADRPEELTALRAGWMIKVTWGDDAVTPVDDHAHVLGRYSAALALPLLSPAAASAWAVQHGLCTHATSLVLVDEASTTGAEGPVGATLPNLRKVPLQAPTAHPMARFQMSRLQAAPAPMSSKMPPRVGFAESFPMFRRAPRDAHLELRVRLERLASCIDWSSVAAQLLSADFSSLTSNELEALRELSATSAVVERAKDSLYPLEVVGLAILAASCVAEDRYALRFARRVLGEKGLYDATARYSRVFGRKMPYGPAKQRRRAD